MGEDREHPSREGSWEEGSTGFAELGDLLRSWSSDGREGGSAAGAELRSAWSGFVDAARDLGQALAATANDPEVRATMKSAMQSLVDTVGTAARDAAGTAAERVRQTAERRKGEAGGTEGDVEGPAPPLVSCAWLADHLDDPDIRIVDTRWFLGQPGAGRLRYEEDHLPGAVFLDLDEDLAASEGPGRHPLLTPDDFADLLGRHGIGNQHHVVVYDQGPGAIAARLWWMLRSVGHERVSVLDGGHGRWSDRDHPLTTDLPDVVATTYETKEGSTLTVDRDELLDLLGTAQVIDAREPERYRGETEPIDSVAGHIPTALSAPTAGNVGTGRHVQAGSRARRPVLRNGTGSGQGDRQLLRQRGHRLPQPPGPPHRRLPGGYPLPRILVRLVRRRNARSNRPRPRPTPREPPSQLAPGPARARISTTIPCV